nr:hypothetical protein [Escherichia coli]
MGKKVIGGGAECSSGIGFIWLVRSIPVNNMPGMAIAIRQNTSLEK